MDQARFNFLLIAFVIVTVAAMSAIGYAFKAAQELKSEKLRSFEFKQMYLSQGKRMEKLISENSVFKLYIQTNEVDKRLSGAERLWKR